jgi:histidyl-tRNA synthetase
LGIRVSLHINNRKILAGIAEVIGQPERIIDITVAIDKLDKIGIDNVNKELLDKGLPTEAVEALQPILNLSGTNTEKLDQLEQVLASSEMGLKGIEELRTIFALYAASTQDGNLATYEPSGLQVELDLCLARGLNYYTGAIFEVKALDAQIGSITGGGRYDNLTGIFGMPGISGVGISFGADRIYDVLAELNLYPENLQSTTQVLFATFGDAELLYALRWAKVLREKGVSVEVYPEPTKMKKQMGYADAKHIPFVAIVGSDEMASGEVMLKNMLTGEQQKVSLEALINVIQ